MSVLETDLESCIHRIYLVYLGIVVKTYGVTEKPPPQQVAGTAMF